MLTPPSVGGSSTDVPEEADSEQDLQGGLGLNHIQVGRAGSLEQCERTCHNKGPTHGTHVLTVEIRLEGWLGSGHKL